MTIERIDLGPIRSRLERAGRPPGSYIPSFLQNVHNESSDLRDWDRPQDDPPDYFISDALDRAVPIDGFGRLREVGYLCRSLFKYLFRGLTRGLLG